MTYFDISHWTIIKEKSGLLLFAQSLEELLAPYSHDSHRVPALNFHYICYEALSVLDLVEKGTLDKGNLIPLIAEMKKLFYQDPVAQKLLGQNFDAIFSSKNSKGEYENKPIKVESSKDIDIYLPTLEKGINFIIAELGRNDQYYKNLIQKIKSKIIDCGQDLLKLDELYELAKIIASELINNGFSQAYIYNCIIKTFFNSNQEVDSVNILDVFFSFFETSEHEYCIYLPLNSYKQKKALEDYGPFKIAENLYEMFNSSIPYILKYYCKATDPYNARENALNLINFCLSVNQFVKHNKYEYNPKYADIVDIENHNVTFIKKPESPIFSGYTNGDGLEIRDLLKTCFQLGPSTIQVLQLHSSALISKSSDNQLINLWTAVEVAIPIVRKGGLSRINQICNALTAVLSYNYFPSLIHQLYLDIKAVSEDAAKKIEQLQYDGSIDEKLLVILLLPAYTSVYNDICQILLPNTPLLVCRIHRYHTKWSNTTDIKNVYCLHCERLSQQIMRIYRTRNLLVHDGRSLLYADYVLKNLHYYIDSFVSFLSYYYKRGYDSIQTIIDAAQFQEHLYLQSLSNNELIDDSNIEKYILRNL